MRARAASPGRLARGRRPRLPVPPLSQSLGEQLLARGLVDAEQLRQASALQKSGNLALDEALVKLGHADEAAVARIVAALEGLPFVDLDKGKVAPEVAARVPKHRSAPTQSVLVRRRSILPINAPVISAQSKFCSSAWARSAS